MRDPSAPSICMKPWAHDTSATIYNIQYFVAQSFAIVVLVWYLYNNEDNLQRSSVVNVDPHLVDMYAKLLMYSTESRPLYMHSVSYRGWEPWDFPPLGSSFPYYLYHILCITFPPQVVSGPPPSDFKNHDTVWNPDAYYKLSGSCRERSNSFCVASLLQHGEEVTGGKTNIELQVL